MESYPLPTWTGQLSFRVLSKTFLENTIQGCSAHSILAENIHVVGIGLYSGLAILGRLFEYALLT